MKSLHAARNRVRRGSGGGNSYWLSFSDLMSALLLIFILIMFYIVYQYFDMYETTSRELAEQAAALSESETLLADRESALLAAEADLIAAESELAEAEASISALTLEEKARREELRDAQDQIDAARAALTAAEAELLAAQADLLSSQEDLSLAQGELALSQAQMEEMAAQLAVQQAQITSQEETLAAQQARLEDLIGVRTDIIQALSRALAGASIRATVDENTGAITLEADVLYSKGNSTLSADGKRVIDEFLPVYLGVLLSDEYRPYVAEIIIEGHTDSDGGYIMNLELSQERALSVAGYILADGYSGITAQQKDTLRTIMTANGRAYSDLIYDENGREDKDASRRVVFKFRLTDEEMIRQMIELLEHSTLDTDAEE